MRIAPIQNHQGVFYTNKTSKKLEQQKQNYKNITDLGYAYMPVSFKNIPNPEVINKINSMSIEKKVVSTFNKLDLGHFLAVSFDMNSINYVLTMAAQRLKTPIEKISYIIDENAQGNMLFYPTPEGKIEFWNPYSSKIGKNGYDSYIEAHETATINEGDSIRFPYGWFKLPNSLDNDIQFLSENQEYFVKTLDFTEDCNKFLTKYNKSIVERLQDKPVETKPKTKPKFSFNNIAGQDHVIKELQEKVLFPMIEPTAFGGIMPLKGAILAGPPGTGKSLIARTLIAESGLSGFIECATEMQSRYVGDSEKHCRELFEKAVEAQPSIIFLDEIDALGKNRGHDVHGDKLLNQFLFCMTEIADNGDDVFVLGATNLEGSLDPAFTRGGRFDLVLECKAPDLKATRDVLDVHTRTIKLEEGIDKDSIAKKMYNKKLAHADIAAVTRNAYYEALRRCGIMDSIREKRYSPMMMDYFSVAEVDFDNAIAKYKKSSNDRKPIGYNK